jgi:hypothetical protein
MLFIRALPRIEIAARCYPCKIEIDKEEERPEVHKIGMYEVGNMILDAEAT